MGEIILSDEPSESDILERSGLERVLAFCNSKGVQVGPFLRNLLGYTTQGGIDYVHGEIRDRRTGHYRLKDGTEAFGGPRETPSEEFLDIAEVPHKKTHEDGKRGYRDAAGKLFSGNCYDSIDPDMDTPLDNFPFRIRDEGLEGYLFDDGTVCGRHNGMNHKSELVEVGDDVYLVQTDKEGYMKVVDIYTGDLVFLDEPQKPGKELKKCTKIEFVQIGHEWCALKSYKDKEQWLRPKHGEVIYEGLTARVGKWFDGKKGPFVRTYDEDGRMIVVGRKKKDHYIKDSDKVQREADDGPAGDGVHTIEEVLLKLYLYKKDPNPADENDTIEVTYRRQDTTDAFNGPNDEEVPDIEGRANTITVAGMTGKLFRNRATGEIYWVGSNGRPMFGRGHWNDLKTIEWNYDFDGNRLGGATILKHLEDVGRGHTVKDYQGNAYFRRIDSNEPDYHTSIRDFWVLSYKKEGEDRNFLVAEAEDPVGFGRGTKSFFSNLFCFRWRRLFRTPSTYHLLDGTKADSIDALKEHLGAPSDAHLVNVYDFKDAVVTKSDPRATQMIRLKDTEDTPSGIAPEIQELFDEAERGTLGQRKEAATGGSLEETLENAGEAASGGKPAKGKTTSLGTELFPEEGQGADAAEEQPADAYAGEAPAPAEGVAEPLPGVADGAPKEGKKQQWPAWLTGSEGDGAPQEGKKPQGLASLLFDESEGDAAEPKGAGQATSEEDSAEDGSSKGKKTGRWLLDGEGDPGAGQED